MKKSKKNRRPGAGFVLVQKFEDEWKVLGLRLYGRYDLPKGGRRLMQKGQGYKATFLGGVATYIDGEPTGALPGKLVRGPQGISV